MYSWDSYLSIAQSLSKLAHGKIGDRAEALKRTAISRAYYSSFHIAKKYAEAVNYVQPTSGGDTHKALSNWFSNSPDNNLKQIGADLFNLKRNRRKADYDDSFTDLDKKVLETVEGAEEIIRLLLSV